MKTRCPQCGTNISTRPPRNGLTTHDQAAIILSSLFGGIAVLWAHVIGFGLVALFATWITVTLFFMLILIPIAERLHDQRNEQDR